MITKALQGRRYLSSFSLFFLFLLFMIYPIGLLVMWFKSEWSVKTKLMVTFIPPIVVAIIVLTFPYTIPLIQKVLEPLSQCVNLCHTKDVYSSCIRSCQESFLNKQFVR